ncbi:hypothetical protein GP486_006226 [Trichoglossum hirsutum]|uniref:Uncharacterized protein n=1 Tax=Trichoglossum hirsutum TaxID=265104 RepID=A0A9P8IEV7_9PEZI|nr:hypothetical protein GP486_006226 [Trichoglossum hirsutum]
MGQDEIYLQVIHTSGEGREKRCAEAVLRLLQRGKHWVLVTLLLSNVITNETLPIVLDRSLGGGWPAVLSSTVLIVIFGEIIPQSICVRYGLPIGAYLSPLVLGLMYILAPVAYPTARLLDYLLGEDHGTVYKKAGLKTLVTLHKSLGTSPSDRLNQDEVTIISAVLDLKDKPVGSIMTPINDVFTMSGDTVLNEQTMDIILSAGYSRIPIHTSDNPHNFIGMLLVKILITYDPEDEKKVSDFALATLPETRPETSCLDIVNYFQEGKSHMVLVSDNPGEDYGALGVVTLEDVIEELIGEEIIDESDVFIDVHKAIRRIAPAPKVRIPKAAIITEPDGRMVLGNSFLDIIEDDETGGTLLARTRSAEAAQSAGRRSRSPPVAPTSEYGGSPKSNFVYRRSSSSAGNLGPNPSAPQSVVAPISPELMAQFKHLGPSNLASKPKQTRYNSVKIKPGSKDEVDGILPYSSLSPQQYAAEAGRGRDAAHGGARKIQAGYGGVDQRSPEMVSDSTQTNFKAVPFPRYGAHGSQAAKYESQSTLGSHRSRQSSRSPNRPKGWVRSGSISENVIHVGGGIRKVILEMSSSSEDADDAGASRSDKSNKSNNGLPSPWHAGKNKNDGNTDGENEPGTSQGGDVASRKSGKKKRRRKRKKADEDESAPLLEGKR